MLNYYDKSERKWDLKVKKVCELLGIWPCTHSEWSCLGDYWLDLSEEDIKVNEYKVQRIFPGIDRDSNLYDIVKGYNG